MNGTIIDIPGIVVNVTPVAGEHTTDLSYLVEIKDKTGKCVDLCIAYGRITHIMETQQSKK